MQVAIDNAKRRFEVELDKEIPRIKKDLDIDINGLPKFWLITKKDKRKAPNDKVRKERRKRNKEKITKNLNNKLVCPMNYLSELKLNYERNEATTLPMSVYFINHELKEHRRKSKRVEEMIQKYSLNVHDFYMNHDGVNWIDDEEDYLLLRADFDSLINDIKKIYISGNYAGMMSWLINRAFKISEQTRGNMDSTLSKNRALLLKVLYSVNPDVFLSCFIEKVEAA